MSKQTNNIVANKICVVSKIGLGTGIFGKMAVKGLKINFNTVRSKAAYELSALKLPVVVFTV